MMAHIWYHICIILQFNVKPRLCFKKQLYPLELIISPCKKWNKPQGKAIGFHSLHSYDTLYYNR